MLTDKWIALYEKYKDKDMGDGRTRRGLERSFTKLSENLWMYWWNPSPKVMSEIWFLIDKDTARCFGDAKEAYTEALNYMYYASDRMNLNRWFRIRCLLNVGKE